jgi:hypothetical protein
MKGKVLLWFEIPSKVHIEIQGDECKGSTFMSGLVPLSPEWLVIVEAIEGEGV